MPGRPADGSPHHARMRTRCGGGPKHRRPNCSHAISVDIGIVAVPAAAAQSVVDKLVAAGIRAILNYAPITAHVPRDISIRHIDPVLAMQSMTFYIKRAEPGAK